jgi:HAD superfamily hydrolase (TIGR01509 family)
VTALFFDCDGVLADTERDGHLPAFNQAFADVGLPVRWSEEEYAEKLRIGGGKERMESLLTPEFVRANGLAEDADGQRELLADWHRRKTAAYKAIVAEGRLPARPGIARIVQEAIDAGWTLAVASTSAQESVEAVLEHAVGPQRAARFDVLAGDIVPKKKPDPGIYLAALERTAARPEETIVIEDSRNGLLAAVAAGLRCVVTISSYTGEEDMREAALVVSDLGDPGRPARVIVNRSPATPGEMVTLDDLRACLEVRPHGRCDERGGVAHG